MQEKNNLLIFTKNPILGTVKTRIGREKGDEIALSVYKALLEITCKVASQVESTRIVYFNNFIEKDGIWSDSMFSKKLQSPGNLGLKMSTALEEVLIEDKKAVIIGSDCAQISKDIIDQAFEELDNYDVVIGPATDGGYYLLGMNKYYSFIFENMPWSHEKLLKATKEVISKNNLTLKLLEEKSDIDYWSDWEKLGLQHNI